MPRKFLVEKLYVEKTELITSKSPRKVLSDEAKIKLPGQRLIHQTQSNISL